VTELPRPPGVRRLFRLPWRTRRQVDADIAAELEFHLDNIAADLHAAGWGLTEAKMEAHRRFGDVNFTRQYCRGEDIRREQEQRRMTFIEELKQDLRYATRSLRASPGFAASALLTLALGIGANAAIFTLVRGVLLEPLPIPDADRVVRVWSSNRSSGMEQASVSEPDLLDWQRETKGADAMGGYFFAEGLSGLDLTGQGNPERLSVALVTDGFFQSLRTPALLGRTLVSDEHVPGRNRVVVLSHGLWTRRFGGDASILGRTVQLNGEPFVVVGVMARGFTYPADRSIDAWIPLSFFGPESIGRARVVRFLSVIARLKPGIATPALQSELASISARLSREYPENTGWDNVTLRSIRDSILGEVRRPLIVLMIAVALLLLIACVNIASLLLARATVRHRELAVRASLGAGRGRIVRQLLTESLTLALLGGILGVALAFVSVRALAAVGARELPRSGDIRIDAAVLAFTFVVAALSGILFGLYPTLRASSANLLASLRAGGGARGVVGGAGQRARSALVVVEVALAVILVAGAGLATKSFARLLSVQPGFVPENALVAMMTVPPRYLRDTSGTASRNYYYTVLDAIRRIPGVQSAGSIRDLPFQGNGEGYEFTRPGKPVPPGQAPRAQFHHVSTDYFRAMGIPLKSGRTFEMTDARGAPPVIVVNEEFARRYFPGEDAVGKSVMFGAFPIAIIGVVGDVRQRGLAEPVDPAMHGHVLQNLRVRMSIVIRTTGSPLSFANRVREAIWSVDSDQTITSVATLESVLGSAVARPRLLAWLLAIFGVVGLTLGALGIFGVLAYSVNQRRQEIGIRVALGASPQSVLRLVVGQGMALTAVGVAAGVIGAAWLTRSMQSVLYGIESSDLATFVQVVVVLLAAALVASWLPARRALRIDPVSALRYD
jgi:predicted permease